MAEAGDGLEAVTLTREHRPEVVLLDIRMPVLDCVDLVVGAVRAGAQGYPLKSMPPEQIRTAVRTAAEGQTALAPTLVERLVQEYTHRRVAPAPSLGSLPERETDVLREIATGRSNQEIAAGLFVSEGTVKTHVAAVLRKLGLRDRSQAAVADHELAGTPGGPLSGLLSPSRARRGWCARSPP